jgi:hypothetical protein
VSIHHQLKPVAIESPLKPTDHPSPAASVTVAKKRAARRNLMRRAACSAKDLLRSFVLNQFFDELAVVDEVLRAAVGVGQDDVVWIDA